MSCILYEFIVMYTVTCTVFQKRILSCLFAQVIVKISVSYLKHSLVYFCINLNNSNSIIAVFVNLFYTLSCGLQILPRQYVLSCLMFKCNFLWLLIVWF